MGEESFNKGPCYAQNSEKCSPKGGGACAYTSALRRPTRLSESSSWVMRSRSAVSEQVKKFSKLAAVLVSALVCCSPLFVFFLFFKFFYFFCFS